MPYYAFPIRLGLSLFFLAWGAVYATLAQEMGQGTSTIGSRLGVIHLGYEPPEVCVWRYGLGGTAGSHTQNIEGEIGVAGILPIYGCQLGWEVAGDLGVYERQWSYEFRGTQSHLATEAFFALPAWPPSLCSPRLGLGWRLDWFANQSYDQLNGHPLNRENDYSLLDQRLGTPFLQCDFCGESAFWRFRFEFGNDADETFGDGGDEFRTAQGRLLCLGQSGSCQVRAGVALDLFTGQTDEDLVDPAFADRSQGLIEVSLGLSRFFRHESHLGELGISLAFGPDTEGIRDAFQNDLFHGTLFPQPPVNLVQRPDRFKTDVTVYYVWHFP